LYWVGVDPEYQGLGLGKAVIARATDMLAGFYGRTPIFLKTQTWSYKAVGIYRKCGYVPTDEKALYRNPRDNYKKAMKILRRI
jgi:ribosomal protein S18 acetylase RimI-like enzyme